MLVRGVGLSSVQSTDVRLADTRFHENIVLVCDLNKKVLDIGLNFV